MDGRHLLSLVVGILLFATSLSLEAQEPDQELERISEAEVLERALNRRSQVEEWEAQVQRAEADIYIEGAFPNPSIGYEREQIFDGAGGSEDTLVLEQLIPLGGRRGLRREAARLNAEAAAIRTRADRAELVESVRESFFEVMQLQMAVELHQDSLARLELRLDRMNRRVEAGESSRYELERLRRDMADIRANLAIRRAELERKRTVLGGWIGIEPGTSFYVTGTLLPEQIPDETQVLEAVGSQPELIAADREIDALSLTRDVANRWWVPDLTLQGGVKTEGRGERHFGMVVGAGLSIPLFYRGRGEVQAASANLVEATNRRSLQTQMSNARALGLLRQASRLYEATRDYQQDAVDRAEVVLELAVQSYDGGEVTMADLLDAHRGLLEAELREVELAGLCRQAFVELERLLDDHSRSERE